MKKICCLAKLYLRDTSGATAIEYSIIAGCMGLMLVPAMTALAPAVEGKYELITGFFDLIN